MTEIPEHLRKRAEAARQRAAAERSGEHDPATQSDGGPGVRIPPHLAERARIAREKAGGSMMPEKPAGLPDLDAFREKLDAVIEERKALFTEQPISQLVLESFETGFTLLAAEKRYPEGFDGDLWQLAWDYNGTLSKNTADQVSRFKERKLRGGNSTSQAIGAGMIGMLRPWEALAEKGVTNPVPEKLDALLFRQVTRKAGVFKVLRDAYDGASITYNVLEVSSDLEVKTEYADAIDSFASILAADVGSPEWDINHWRDNNSFSLLRGMDAEVCNPKGFVAGARLVASLME